MILSAIIFFSLKFFVNLFLVDELTYKAKYDELNLEKEYKSIIFRKEIIVNTNVSGSIKYFVNEGEKVKKGYKIAEIEHDNSNDDVVEKVETDVVDFKKKLLIDIKKMDDEIEELKNRIFLMVEEKNYLEVSKLKEELLLKLEKKNRIENNKKLIDIGSSSFAEKFVGKENLNIGDKVNFYSPISGIVSFYMDKLEPNLTIENIYNLNYSEILNNKPTLISLTSNRISEKNPVYKIVDNSLWFLVSIIDKEEINYYDKNQKVSVIIDSDELTATVADVFETDEEAALILKFSEQYKDFYKKRFVDAKIIRENYQGLKIKNSSMTYKDNIVGVYILDIDGRAIFRPIKILGKDKEYSIVKSGYFYDIKTSEKTKTIDSSDEIVIEASKYSEGDKVY